jgi:ApaG protein
LWKSISTYERKAVELLSLGDEGQTDEALKLLAKSVGLKKSDPFLQLADSLSAALDKDDTAEVDRLLADMKSTGVPPHIASLIAKQTQVVDSEQNYDVDGEDIDPGSTFSDTVTEKIRVKVSSFYDSEKSDPANGKYMFWYKVGIYNEGSEPVQIVARMWEIEKCKGEKEVVRGAGIMSTQPIIPPGDVFTYQSVCPLKVFPAKGKRLLGSMSGAYTMCKGNMGQHNFTVKVGKFNLILPTDKPAK